MVRIALGLALLALLGHTAVAQTAKVVELSPEDAKLAKSLFDQKASVEKQIADLHERILVKLGWNGFEYSQDFRFVVPYWQSPYIIPCCNLSTNATYGNNIVG